MVRDAEVLGVEAGHPGVTDPEYLARRDAVAGAATGAGQAPARIAYTSTEHRVWAEVQAALAPEWERHACAAAIEARDRLALPVHELPQLADVSRLLAPISGFRYEAVPGLVPKEQFFACLAEGRFLSTQYVRHEATPLYTPEPDVIHEVIGHANCLADGRLAELHRLAGRAISRLELPESRQFVSDVFWFSGEFGVVREDGRWKAYGAGILSSYGELRWFGEHAEVRPLDPAAMGSLPYDIAHYQPVLFGARALDEVLDVVGGFFAEVDDDVVLSLPQGAGHRVTTSATSDTSI